MSEEQKALQDELVERYEKVRNTKVDPRIDNALAITGDGRKLALDARLLSPSASDFPDSKLNRMVRRVHQAWQRSTPTRGTQIIFCDLGVNPTPWAFCLYDDMVAKLASVIPRGQIACIGEADTDGKKRALFEKVRGGVVRVLIGSTERLGAGTNVQKRLVAKHDLDAPWRPSDLGQRDGRIKRQGNIHDEVEIDRYVTEGSFDAYTWQALETKARSFAQLFTGQKGLRRIDDIAEQVLSYAEVKAIASGNPAVLTLAEADAELQRLSVLKRSHFDGQFLARRNVRDLPEVIDRMTKRLSALEADATTVESNPAKLSLDALAKSLDRVPLDVHSTRRFPLGKYRELSFGLERHPGGMADVYLDGETSRGWQLSRDAQGPRAVANALGRLAESYPDHCERVRKELEVTRSQLTDWQAKLGKPFVHAAYIEELSGLRDQLKLALSDKPPEGLSPAELAEKIKTLRAGHKVEAASLPKRPEKPVRTPVEHIRIEEPVELTPVEAPPPSFRERVTSRVSQRSLF